MTSIKNVVKDELIGLHVTVVEATNPALVGIKGQVIDETKNTLVVKNSKRSTLVKDQVVIETEYNNKKLRVDGKKLTRRPEDRIKER